MCSASGESKHPLALVVVSDAVAVSIYQQAIQQELRDSPWKVGGYFGMGVTALDPSQFVDPAALEKIPDSQPRLLALSREDLQRQLTEILSMSAGNTIQASKRSAKVCLYLKFVFLTLKYLFFLSHFFVSSNQQQKSYGVLNGGQNNVHSNTFLWLLQIHY